MTIPDVLVEQEQDSFTTQAVVFAFVAIVLLALVMPLLRRIFSTGGSSAQKSSVKRSSILFTGLSGSGKTRLFWKLVHQRDQKTHSSLVPNLGTLKIEGAGSWPAVDYPGHRRLRKGLWQQVAAARVVVVVVDSVKVQDTGDEGGHAVAELIRDILRAPESRGLKSMIICSNKRDELTSYSAKSLRKILAGQLGKLFDSQSGTVAAMGRQGMAASDADEVNPFVAVDNEVFDFDASAMDFEFLDCSAQPDGSKFSMDTLSAAIVASA